MCLPCPNHFALVIAQSYPIMTGLDGLPDIDRKLERDRVERLESMWLFSARPGNLPSNEARFVFSTAFRLIPFPRLRGLAVPARHRGFVPGDDFVGRPVLANGAIIDPHHAMAQAADLIELVGDKHDGAAGAGHVTHFAEAFFLEVDVADGEDFIDEENFRLEMGGDGEGEA